MIDHANDAAVRPATMAEVIRIAASLTGTGIPVTGDSTYESMHWDSLTCVEFAVALEDGFEIHVSCTDRVCSGTLAQVAAMVDGRIGDATGVAIAA